MSETDCIFHLNSHYLALDDTVIHDMRCKAIVELIIQKPLNFLIGHLNLMRSLSYKRCSSQYSIIRRVLK
jgi:hypothetical protein